jgi:hypothetical protein
MRKYIPLFMTFIALATFILGAGFLFLSAIPTRPTELESTVETTNTISDTLIDTEPHGITSEPAPTTGIPSRPIGDVPFTVQAPNANWDDPILQDGCEEASLLMAKAWIKGEALPEPSAVSDAIHALADFEEGRFDHHEDVSLSELFTVMREYFDHENAHILSDATLESIVSEIETGNLVLAPSYGRALGNPHFTAPGPVTHMLVLIGYDPEAHEFVVNDPGTRHGAGYRYDEDILFDAIWAYPPGPTHPEPPKPAERIKSALIISRS